LSQVNLSRLLAAQIEDLAAKSPQNGCDGRWRHARYPAASLGTIDLLAIHKARERNFLGIAAPLAGDRESGVDHPAHSLPPGGRVQAEFRWGHDDAQGRLAEDPRWSQVAAEDRLTPRRPVVGQCRRALLAYREAGPRLVFRVVELQHPGA